MSRSERILLSWLEQGSRASDLDIGIYSGGEVSGQSGSMNVRI